MRESDLGIGTDGRHNMMLTPIERDCLDTLQNRVGNKAAISANELTMKLGLDIHEPEASWQERVNLAKRKTRALINHLIITHEIPIICKAGSRGGYFLAGSPGEVDEFYKAYHKRAMTGLLKASRGKRASFVSIVTQLSFGFEATEDKETIEKLRLLPENEQAPAWVQIVTKMLGRLAEDPQKYAAEIRQIQRTYGDIFVPRDKIKILREKTAEFQRLLSEIEPEKAA